jgi:hypothetical protein
MPIRRFALRAVCCVASVLFAVGAFAQTPPIRTSQNRSGSISVTDCGASPSAPAAVNLAAFQACLLATGGQVVAPGPGTYHLSGGISIGGAAGAFALVGVGGPTLAFDGLGPGVDGVTLVGDHYRPSLLKDLAIDLGGAGEDGVVLRSGSHPVISGVSISNAGRDNLAVYTTGWSWVQNPLFSNVRLNNAGRHAIRLETAGANGAFINDIDMESIEIRGVGGGGNPIYARAGGTTVASQISRVTGSITIDFQNRAGAQADPNFIRFAAAPGGANAYASWHITGGGWENTGAAFVGGVLAPLAFAEPGAGVAGLTIEGVVPGAHVSFNTPNIAPVKIEVSPRNAAQMSLLAGWASASTLVNADAVNPSSSRLWLCRQGPVRTTYANMPQSVCLNSARPADQDDGAALGGAREFRSDPLAANRAGQTVVIRKVVRPAIGAYADDVRTLKIDLQSWQFNGAGNIFQREYLLMISPSGKVQALQVADGSSAGMVAAVAFSVSGEDLVVSLTTGAAWGTGGGASTLHGAVFEPLFVP